MSETKKFFVLLLSLALMLGAAGCSSSENEPVPTETETAVTTKMKSIDPPVGIWTSEMLNEVMYLCGESFSLPCSEKYLNDLDIQLFNEDYLGERDYESIPNADIYSSGLSYGGDDLYVGWVNYYYNENNEKVIFGILIHETNLFSINGITIGSELEESNSALGSNFQPSEVNHSQIYLVSAEQYPKAGFVIIPSLSDDRKTVGMMSYSLYS